MLTNREDWWTDERIDATVTAHFVYSHLRPLEAEKLAARVFTTFSDDTYLQWILRKTKRLFLILVAGNISGQIFRLIEESYDDDDLPIPEEDLSSLRLPRERHPNIEQVFNQCQFRYLLRVVAKGEHIRYSRSEIVPVQGVQQKAIAVNAPDHVRLPLQTDTVLLRKTMRLTDDYGELDILSEIAAIKTLEHDHILSVFGSYVRDENLCVLLLPAPKNTLKSFLNDIPKPFAALTKIERRRQLFIWSTCLVNAIAWLHGHGVQHGAVRPSRILIEADFQPCLGQFEGEGVLRTPTSKDDLDAYQYGAPENWRRELTVQGGGTSRSLSSQLGRTVSTRQAAPLNTEHATKWDSEENGDEVVGKMFAFVPAAKGNGSRLKLETIGKQRSVAALPERNLESRMSTRDTPSTHKSLYRRFDALSMRSSDSSDGKTTSGPTNSPLYSMPLETKTTIVQTWKSAGRHTAAADVFGLATVIMDILTVLCSRTTAAFAKHRASKNRQAGRGGGLADASFHANLASVVSWAEQIHKDAEKKMKKDEGTIFGAIGPTLQVVLQCLDREPTKRMKSSSLAKRLYLHLKDFANVSDVHCELQLLGDIKAVRRTQSNIAEGTQLSTHTRRHQVLPHTANELPGDSRHRKRDSRTAESFSNSRPSTEVGSNIQMDEMTTDEDHYDDPHPGTRWPVHHLSPQQFRNRVRIAPSISEDGFVLGSPLPSLMSGPAGTLVSSQDPDGPETPATAKSSYSLFPGYSPSNFKPPDRDLPPVPRILPVGRDRKTVQGHRSTGSGDIKRRKGPQLADVGHATDLLAEEIEGSKDRHHVKARSSNTLHSLTKQRLDDIRGVPRDVSDRSVDLDRIEQEDVYHANPSRRRTDTSGARTLRTTDHHKTFLDC